MCIFSFDSVMQISILSASDTSDYDAWIRNHPHGSLWQSLERKQYAESLGKEVRIYIAKDGDVIRASASVVIDRTTRDLSTWDIPRGPLWDEHFDEDSLYDFMTHIQADAKQDKCMALYCSTVHTSLYPDVPIIMGKKSPRHIHCEATRIIDLTKSDEEILAQMKPKGRYNIKVAAKKNVETHMSRDVNAFHALAAETGKRDGFVPQSKKHYEAFMNSLSGSFLLLATTADSPEPIAGLMGVIWNGKGIYYYGASSYEHRALMAPYALQWSAMAHCKNEGCLSYDLLGIAPEGSDNHHPWAGITSFKEKFGGTVINYPSETQSILRPVPYGLIQIKRKLLG